MNPNDLTRDIIGAAIEVHRQLGPGKPEVAYERALCHELDLRQISHQAQRPLAVVYKTVKLDCGYRLDVLVDNRVVVEIKSVEALAPIHAAQLLTYLKLGAWKLGLLLNFNVAMLRGGIKRRVLNLEEVGRITAEPRRAQRSERLPSSATDLGQHLRGDRGTNELSYAVIAAAMEVHGHLGPGLLESAYSVCLCHELALRRIPFERCKPVPLTYKGIELQATTEVALLVAGRVLVQPKAVETIEAVHKAQLLSQLGFGHWPQGLLLNFNARCLSEGLVRFLNDGQPRA